MDAVADELRRKALENLLQRQQETLKANVESEAPPLGKDLEDGELPVRLQSTAELAAQVEGLNREHDQLATELRQHDEKISRLIQQQAALKEELKRIKDAIFQGKSHKFQLQARIDERREQLQHSIRQLAMSKKGEREQALRNQKAAQVESDKTLLEDDKQGEDSLMVHMAPVGEPRQSRLASPLMSPYSSSDEKTVLSLRLATIEQELGRLKARAQVSAFDCDPLWQSLDRQALKGMLLAGCRWTAFGSEHWLPSPWVKSVPQPAEGQEFFFPNLVLDHSKSPPLADGPEWLLMLSRLLSMAPAGEVVQQAMLANAASLDAEQWLLAWDLCRRHQLDPAPLLATSLDHPLIRSLCIAMAPDEAKLRSLLVSGDELLKGAALLRATQLGLWTWALELLGELAEAAPVLELPYFKMLGVLVEQRLPMPAVVCRPAPLQHLLWPSSTPPLMLPVESSTAFGIYSLLVEYCLPHRLHAACLSMVTFLLLHAPHLANLDAYHRLWPSCPSMATILAVLEVSKPARHVLPPATVYFLALNCPDQNFVEGLVQEQWRRLSASLHHRLSPDQIMLEHQDTETIPSLPVGTQRLVQAWRQDPLLKWSHGRLSGVAPPSQPEAAIRSDLPLLPFAWSASHVALNPSFISFY